MKPIEKYLSSDFWQSDELEHFSSIFSKVKFSTIKGAILFGTSGTSGERKAVVHSRETLLASAELVIDWLEVTSRDCWYLALPINHVGGFGVLARSYLSGCMIVQHQGKWSVEQCIHQMKRTNVTIVSLVPTQIYDLVNARAVAPESLRAVIVGGGKLETLLKQQAIELGWNILETYGMTETGSMIATQRSSSDQAIELIQGWQVRINSQGLLELKGAGLMHGYAIKNSEEWELQTPFQSGWFTTSDKVLLNGRGLVFQERSDRVVKILGELVNLETYEKELRENLCFEVLLVDIPDERRGARLVPVVENEEQGIDLLALLLAWSQTSGPSELSESYICSQLPRNQMGKLDRETLRDSIVKSRQTS